jgi:hypothetical protein
VYVPQESVELKQPELPAREENIETPPDATPIQQPELPAPEENVETPPEATPVLAGAHASAVAAAPEAALTPQAPEKPAPEEKIFDVAAGPVSGVVVPDKENVEDNSDASESSQLPDHLKWPEIQP